MSSIDFVKQLVDILVTEFQEIQCRYQYKVSSNIHFIEILPSNIYKLEVKYAEAETKATLAFIELYPDEGICFITEDAIVKLDNPIYIKKGARFAVSPNVVLPGTVLTQSELMNWKTPFYVDASQSKFLHNILVTTLEISPFQDNKLKAFQFPSVVISGETEILLAA